VLVVLEDDTLVIPCYVRFILLKLSIIVDTVEGAKLNALHTYDLRSPDSMRRITSIFYSIVSVLRSFLALPGKDTALRLELMVTQNYYYY
jgi:hypothetical protein